MDKATILKLLETDKRAVARALVVLNERQTADEQATENTRYQNGRGFRPCHARMGTSMAKQFLQRKSLSDKQIEYWRKRDATGAMRIGIYWGQLLEEAKLKMQNKAAPAVNTVAQSRDLGNDMERKLQLEYELGMALDSDDPAIINPIQKEIDDIDAFWEKIRRQQP